MIKEFLEHVLPDVGELICWVKDTKRTYAGDLDTISKLIDEQNSLKTVYHACASFYPGGVRDQSSVCAVKSFWLDLDSKRYSKSEQISSLVRFVKELSLPAPTLVDSGNGIHVYWTLDKNLDPSDWEATAHLLKEAVNKFGLDVDHARTCDSASLLRPVGTLNRKDLENPKDVKLLKKSPHTSHESFHAALKAYVGEIFGEILSPSSVGTLNSDLEIQREPLPNVTSSRIADVCAQVGLFRSLRGDVPEPMWFAALGTLAYTSDGADKAHEWSKGHAGYDPAQTDEKFAHVSKQSGMTTCAALQAASPQPGLCTSCPFYNKCATPRGAELQAARPNVVTTQVDAHEDVDSLFADVVAPTLVEEEIFIPGGWAIFADHGLDSIHVWCNPDVNWWEATTSEYMAKTNFRLMVRGILYSNGYILDRHGNYIMRLVFKHGPANSLKKTLVLTGGQISATRELMSELGKKGIGSLSSQERHLTDYIKSIMAEHQTRAEQRAMYNHFGWHGDDFLTGDTLYRADGTNETITLGKTIQEKAHILKPVGSLDNWKNIINTAYNHPGCEALQFAVLCGFAAPLMAHYQSYGGICVHLYSPGSGKGKTTAAQAALSVWGNPTQMMMSDKQATINAIYATMGMYHTLPILYDEVTNKEDETIADFVHVTSSGQPKQRCDASGKVIENEHSWKTIVLTSGNKKLSDKLRSTRDNIEAETARIFEFTVAVKHHLVSSEAIRLFGSMQNNYGTAGAVYAEYLASNKETVGKALDKALDAVGSKFQTTSSERYWSVLLASVMVANNICIHLGLLNFNKANLTEWIKKTVMLNRGTMAEVVPTIDDAFGRMINELWQGVIVTEGEGSFVGGRWAKVEHKPKEKVFGRCIVDRVPENNKVYLSSTAVKNWCLKNGKNYKEFLTDCIDNKMVSSYVSKYPLGKGTVEYDRLPETEVVTLTQATVASLLSGGNLVSIPGGKSDERKETAT